MRRRGAMRISVIFSLVAILLLAPSGEGQKAENQSNASVASPQAVCAYIVGRMTTTLPQQPTLCSGKQGQASGYYSISIFSPKNVLEGDARRAWSSALFQTLEDLVEEKSLNGACSATPNCEIRISDAYLAQHNWRYRTFLDKDGISLLRGKSTPSALAEFSEHWYITWWQSLFAIKESDNPGSRENAIQMGKSACEDYIAALRKMIMNSELPIPTCSVMLANDKNIYLALDFEDWIYTRFGEYIYKLPPAIGRIFDDTGYGGQVIIRSPWSSDGGSPHRIYQIYPLRAIEFAYEEKESGLRGEGTSGGVEVENMLETNFNIQGQTSENDFDSSILADAAVVRYATGPDGTVIVDMTDGAEWKISKESFDRCNLGPGVEINVSTLLISGDTASLHGTPVLSTQKVAAYCKLTATFVKGW
jgi:hypothetical protein